MTLHVKPGFHALSVASGSVYTPRASTWNRTAGSNRPDPENGFYNSVTKRLLDVLLGLIVLLLVAPVLMVLSLALWIESGNPFYFQSRLGRNGHVFRMWKLRTMVIGADRKLADCLASDPALKREWEMTQKLKNDPRITPLGRLLRRTSLDELPQIFNVLKGEMSLVGPRPMLPEQMDIYLHPEAYKALRPGITGLWQVTARNEEAFAMRATIDQYYHEKMSLRMDIRIIAATFGTVLNGTGY